MNTPEEQWLKSFLLDLIFPRFCIGCGSLIKKSGNDYVCHECLLNISFMNGFVCAFCNAATIDGKTCPFCRKDHYLDRLWVAVSYEDKLATTMIKALKYKYITSVGKNISGIMIHYLEKKIFKNRPIQDRPILIPVPLNSKRLRQRGFNQAEIIAHNLSFNLGWQTRNDLLSRSRQTQPQANLKNKSERIKNIENSFSYNTPADFKATGKIFVLIDDVATTGSTLNDCARVLKNAGAKEVIGFVFARNI